MKIDYLKELGLTPVWRLKDNVAAPPPVVAAQVESPPQTVVAQSESSPPTGKSPTPPPASESQATIAIGKMDWVPLQAAVAGCHACGLSKERTQTVFGDGNTAADVMLVGEGPGYEEDIKGLPFVGRAGQLLDAMLRSIERSRESNVYIANIVKCRPPQNRNPEHNEAQACLPYLARQIELVQPRLLVALGKVAVTHLLKTEESISQLRQKLHDYHNIPVVVTYHPAYLLRNPTDKRKAWDDLLFIQSILAQ